MTPLRFSDDWLEVLRAARDESEVLVRCSDEGCVVTDRGVPEGETLRVTDMTGFVDMSIAIGDHTYWSETVVVDRVFAPRRGRRADYGKLTWPT